MRYVSLHEFDAVQWQGDNEIKLVEIIPDGMRFVVSPTRSFVVSGEGRVTYVPLFWWLVAGPSGDFFTVDPEQFALSFRTVYSEQGAVRS